MSGRWGARALAMDASLTPGQIEFARKALGPGASEEEMRKYVEESQKKGRVEPLKSFRDPYKKYGTEVKYAGVGHKGRPA